MVYDNGTDFTSREFQILIETYAIEQKIIQ